MQQSLSHRLGWNGTSKSRETENRDCPIFGSLKVLYAVRRPIAKQTLVTIFSAVARKSHDFLFVSRAMESVAVVQLILLKAFPTRATRWPAASPTTGSYVTFHMSHYIALWQSATDTLSCGWATGVTQSVREFHTTHSSAAQCQTETASFIGSCRHGADKCLWRKSYAGSAKPLECLCLGP